MNVRVDPLRAIRTAHARSASGTAAVYNEAGDGYAAYADGDPRSLYAFDGNHAYCDRKLWEHLDALLVARRETGATTISILDAGCGPGMWLRRVIVRAHQLGFTTIKARGFDLAAVQIAQARALSDQIAALPGVHLAFEIGDLTRPLPEKDASIDLCLCLYGVLTHVPMNRVPKVLHELARVTSGALVATVRAAGSTPTIFIDGLDRAQDFRQNHTTDQCQVEMKDGRRLTLDTHLYTAAEFRTLIEREFRIATLRGLDLFHTRFAPDQRWNPPSAEGDGQFRRALDRLEEEHARNPHFIDRAAHLLVIASPRPCEPEPAKKLHLCLKAPHTSVW